VSTRLVCGNVLVNRAAGRRVVWCDAVVAVVAGIAVGVVEGLCSVRSLQMAFMIGVDASEGDC